MDMRSGNAGERMPAEDRCSRDCGAQSFLYDSSCHGLAHVGRSASARSRATWLLLYLVALALCGLHLSKCIGDYMRLSYQEVVSTAYRPDVPFPDVTFCNIFVISLSKKIAMDLLTNKYMYQPMANETCKRGRGNYSDREDALVRLVGQDVLAPLTHRLEDMVQFCQYASKPCNLTSDFIPYFDTNFLQCYTFNGSKVNERLRLSPSDYAGMGAGGGLSLVLFAETTSGAPSTRTLGNAYRPYDGFYYSPSKIMSASGMRFVIHPQGTKPFPVEKGVDASVGQSTTLALRARNTTRLRSPYRSNCTDAGLVHGTRLAYTQLVCIQACTQRRVMEACGCSSIQLPRLNVSEPVGVCGANICNYTDIRCHDRIVASSTLGCLVDCPRPCSELSYAVRLSSSYWPGEEYQESFLYKGPLNSTVVRDLLGLNTDKYRLQQIVETDLVTKNFQRVNIFFEDYFVEISKESGLYSKFALLSDVGGVLGLWVGMSVLSLAEFLVCFSKMLPRKSTLPPEATDGKRRVAAAGHSNADKLD